MKGIEYYAAVAQIIPVLLLVIGVEYRLLLDIDRSPWWAYLVAGIAVGWVAGGEFFALNVLRTEKAGRGDYVLTLSVLIMLFICIGAIAAGAIRRPRSAE